MPAEIPTTEPTELIAGDTWRWDRSLPDFDAADGYVLSYAVRGPSDLAIAGAMVTVVGSGWEVRVPAASTNLTPGNYRLIGFVTLAGERDTVVDAPLLVVANPATSVGKLGHDEKVLAAIDAVIEGRATVDLEETQVNGRMIKHIPFDELLRIQGIYRRRVVQARDPDGEPRTVEAVFSAPC